jgi:hypothetical protein
MLHCLSNYYNHLFEFFKRNFRFRAFFLTKNASCQNPAFFAASCPGSLSRFAHKTSKNRRSDDFFPCNLRRTEGSQQPDPLFNTPP